MIIKNNFATNPIKNYTLFLLSCLALTIVVGAFSTINVRLLTASFRQSRILEAKMSDQLKQRSDMQRQSTELKNKVSKIKTQKFITETEFLNNAIKRRVFSWTALFDQFERVFPDSVKMVSVLPNIREENINISMEVAGRSLNDLMQLIDRLQKSGTFSNVVFRSERQDTADGFIYATISLLYLPDQTAAAAQRKTAVSKTPGVAAGGQKEGAIR